MAKKKATRRPRKSVGTAKKCKVKTFKSSVAAAAYAAGMRSQMTKAQAKKVNRSKNKVTICK